MTPAGLALFYSGMTRSKNTLNTIYNGMGALFSFFSPGIWLVGNNFNWLFGEQNPKLRGFPKFYWGGFSKLLWLRGY